MFAYSEDLAGTLVSTTAHVLTEIESLAGSLSSEEADQLGRILGAYAVIVAQEQTRVLFEDAGRAERRQCDVYGLIMRGRCERRRAHDGDHVGFVDNGAIRFTNEGGV